MVDLLLVLGGSTGSRGTIESFYAGLLGLTRRTMNSPAVVVVAVAVEEEEEEVIGPWWVKGESDLVPWAARILLRRGTGSSTTRFVYLTSTMKKPEMKVATLFCRSLFHDKKGEAKSSGWLSE